METDFWLQFQKFQNKLIDDSSTATSLPLGVYRGEGGRSLKEFLIKCEVTGLFLTGIKRLGKCQLEFLGMLGPHLEGPAQRVWKSFMEDRKLSEANNQNCEDEEIQENSINVRRQYRSRDWEAVGASKGSGEVLKDEPTDLFDFMEAMQCHFSDSQFLQPPATKHKSKKGDGGDGVKLVVLRKCLFHACACDAAECAAFFLLNDSGELQVSSFSSAKWLPSTSCPTFCSKAPTCLCSYRFVNRPAFGQQID